MMIPFVSLPRLYLLSPVVSKTEKTRLSLSVGAFIFLILGRNSTVYASSPPPTVCLSVGRSVFPVLCLSQGECAHVYDRDTESIFGKKIMNYIIKNFKKSYVYGTSSVWKKNIFSKVALLRD